MNRNKLLTSIRPILQLNVEQSTKKEKFQNLTLRPILKLQNELLKEIFRTYIQKRKFKFDQKAKIEKAEFIQHSLKTDQRLKQYLLGLVIGHFTLDEYQSYLTNESEYNRRIISMLIQRLESQFIKTSSDLDE